MLKTDRSKDLRNNSAGFSRTDPNAAAGPAIGSYITAPVSAASVQTYDSNGNLIGNFTTIQAAVNAATDGSTIIIGGGTYTEQVTITGKHDLTIQTAPRATVTVRAPSDVVQNATMGSGRGVDAVIAAVNSTNLVITGITVDGAGSGASADGLDNFIGVFARNSSVDLETVNVKGVRDASITGSQRGYAVYVDNDAPAPVSSSPVTSIAPLPALLGFTMNGGTVSDFQKGGVFLNYADIDVSGVTVSNPGATSTLAQNGIIVFHSTGSISGNTVSGVGYSGTVDNTYSGLILGASNTNLDITNNILTGTNGTGSGQSNDSHVVGVLLYDLGTPNSGGTVSGNTITGVDTGIDISGAMGPNAVALGTNTISSIDTNDAAEGGISYLPNSDTAIAFNLTGTGFDDKLGGGSLSDTLSGGVGNDQLTGNGGNDTLNGGTGNDTAIFSENRADATLTSTSNAAGFVTAFSKVASSAGGTDTLTSVEALRFADVTIDLGDPIQLFAADGSLTDSFTSLQAALDASADGSTIRVLSGTYDESLTITHAVTILGANAGISGSDGDRGGETLITGGVNVQSNGVTIDGVKITGQTDGSNNGLALAGVSVVGNDFTIENSVLSGENSTVGTSRAILTSGGTGLAVSDNLIEGYDQGMYISAQTGSVTGNLFQGDPGNAGTGLGNGIISESTGVTIGDNTFDDIIRSSINVQPFGVTGTLDVSTYVLDTNVFTNTIPRPVVITPNPTTDFIGTDFNDRLFGDGSSNSLTFSGGLGDDYAVGSSAADTLTGNAGSDTLFGGGGNDTLNGDDAPASILSAPAQGIAGSLRPVVADVDTALFTGRVSDATITGDISGGTLTAFRTVSTVDGGTDTLNGIEQITFDQGTEDTADDVTIVAGAPIQRFNSDGSIVGTYTTIQAAIDAASDGDTIGVAAGTYDEALTIDKAITLKGANAGIAGTGLRGDETIITGINVVADDVTIDGVKITGETSTPTFSGTYSGVTVAGDDLSLVNSVLSGGPVTDPNVASRAILTTGVTGLDIGANLIEGYDQGLYLSAGTTGSIHDNSFQGVDGTTQNGLGNGIVSETAGITIGNNVFDSLYATVISLEPFGVSTVDAGTVVLSTNVFTNDVAQPIRLYPTVALNFTGTTFNDRFVGTDATAATTFDGAGGNDLALGSANADTLNGGAGNDNLQGAGGSDILDGGAGDDSIDGGAGTDTVTYASATAGVTVSLLSTTAQNTVGAGVDTITTVENLTGSGFGDTLTGNTGANVINGGAGNDTIGGGLGNDTINGGADNDTISGGAGNDTLNGGDGFDIASYAEATSAVFVSLGTTGVQTTGGGGNDTLSGFEGLIGGSGADFLSGDDADNRLEGGAGSDTLVANGGNDTLIGGLGNDTLNGGVGTDTADYSSAGSGVTVDLGTTDAQDTIGAGTDTLLGIESVIGSAFADTLTAAADPGTLTGGGGGDLLTAGSGGNVLDGGANNDTLVSGAGNDTLSGGSGNDTASFANASGGVVATLAGTATGDGSDTLFSIENLVGSGSADSLTGSNAANTLDGGRGADLLYGLGGDDLYFVDNASDQVFEVAGAGTDKVGASVSYTLATGQSIEQLSTTSASGTDAINLTGNEIANTISGNAGNNTLDGGAGVDILTGREGDDLYFVDNARDRVIEAVGEGTDKVGTSVSYTLAAGQSIEQLSTTSASGTDAINLTGNEIANTLSGNNGVNTLDGGGGADTLIGRGGDDLYFVDDANDKVIEAANEGTDKVGASVSYTLGTGQSIEQLSTTSASGTGAINLTGNEIANTISGNAGNNTLDGGGGADTLIGRGGDDLYLVDSANDQVFERVGEGTDKVGTSVSYTLGTGQSIEQLSTTSASGTGAINLTGNEIANTINGNNGANILDGKGGADTLFGRGGADVFGFTTTLGGGNIDTILDFANSTNVVHDTISLSRSVFTQLGAGSTLASGAFKDITSGAPVDGDDRILYNRTTGALFYDADGSGSTAAVQFATLSNRVALSANDFAVG